MPVYVALAVAVVSPSALQGQGVVRSAALHVDLTAGRGEATARVEYVLTLDGGATEITVEALVPEGIEVVDLFTGGGVPVVLSPTGAIRRSARVTLGPSSGNDHSLIVDYRVEGGVRDEAGSIHARVPILTVRLPPTEGGDVLRAAVRVPPEWSVSERFPSGLRETEEGAYEVALPVVPSVISMRGRSDGGWRPGLGLILEALTALILAGFGLTAWRRLAGGRA